MVPENAAIHEWYHEHPEKDREAKEEGTEPKSKPAHATIREAASVPSKKGITTRNLNVKELGMREKANSKQPKQQIKK